jgi:lysylphosphatidylglycerol synthetase-like protein (DUF2156 family)
VPPLRAHVTVASQVMLPTYVLFFAIVGGNYLTTDRALLRATPALRFADDHFPLPVCGGMFVACALLMLVALAAGRTRWSRALFSYALIVSMICNVLWAVVFLFASIQDDASPTAGAWPMFVATACLASYLSLRAGEA